MERSGAGDPARTLELLWRRPEVRAPGKRGPRSGLGVDAVVATAVQLADAEGLAAASMRRVAQALGVTAMSLYTYVPGKGELIDLMLDAVHGAMVHTDRAEQPWRERLAAVADADDEDAEDAEAEDAEAAAIDPRLAGLWQRFEMAVMNIFSISIQRFIGNHPVPHMDNGTVGSHQGNSHSIHDRVLDFKETNFKRSETNFVIQ